jgi:hypothetical protein
LPELVGGIAEQKELRRLGQTLLISISGGHQRCIAGYWQILTGIVSFKQSIRSGEDPAWRAIRRLAPLPVLK